MKQRIISGAIIAILTAVVVIVGGKLFLVAAALIAARGAYEFCSSRNHKINWLEFAIMLAFVFLLNLFFDKALGILLAYAVALITLAVFDKNVVFDEMCVNFFESILLGFTIHYMIEIEFLSKWLFAYIVIIAYLTDVFALFTGMKFGKHKLNERISPKKTIEGAIGGWLIGAVVSFLFALCFKFFYMEPGFILICSLILPIVSQIGDLSFSLIKRHYGIKDFSNLIPGHGGILDRFDSMSFVLIVYGMLAILIGIY